MNIAVIGTSEDEKALVELCKTSKNLTKIYTASNSNIFDNIPNVEYYNTEDLIQRLKHLKIDALLTCNKSLIQNGLSDITKPHRLNAVCMNKKWANIEVSELIAKQLLRHYNINTPQKISYPATFPVVLKLDSNSSKNFIIKSIKELIQAKEKLSILGIKQGLYIEEYIEGEEFTLCSIWDKASMYYFPVLKSEDNSLNNLTEVQKDRLDLLKTKMNFMFSDESADFTGFVITKLLWAKNDWYILKFQSYLSKTETEQILMKQKQDFLFILNAAIYQKLGELEQ